MSISIVSDIVRTLSSIVNPDIFKHIHVLFSHIVACLQPYVTLAYSQPCDIENTGIFYRYKKKLLEPKIYSECYVKLACILRTLPYSEFWNI